MIFPSEIFLPQIFCSEFYKKNVFLCVSVSLLTTEGKKPSTVWVHPLVAVGDANERIHQGQKKKPPKITKKKPKHWLLGRTPTSSYPHFMYSTHKTAAETAFQYLYFWCSPSLFLVLHPAPRQEAGFFFFKSPTASPTPLLPTNLPHLCCHAVGPLLLFQLNINFQPSFFSSVHKVSRRNEHFMTRMSHSDSSASRQVKLPLD